MTPIELLLSKLENPKKNGRGWIARCPAHDDRNPSLSINEGEGGRALLKCFAGCANENIVEAIGLTMADLMPARDGPPGNAHAPAGGPRRGRKSKSSTSTSYPTIDAAINAIAQKVNGRHVQSWTYTDGIGAEVFHIARFETDKGKQFRPIHRDRDGYRIGDPDPGTPGLPIYNLRELNGAQRVFVVEGEKCADQLRTLGLTVTTSAHGSKAAMKSDWKPLAGMLVIIIPDNDAPGRKYAETVAAIVTRLGAEARIVELDGLDEGEDIADWIEERDAHETEALRAHIEALADAAPVWKPEAPGPVIDAYRRFPVAVLPEPIRSFVADAAMAIGCDPAYVALPTLAALAASIGNTHRIALKRGWSEPAILWTAIVGESGTLKTPPFKAAMKALRKAQSKAFKEHDTARATWEADHLRYDAALTAWKRQAAKAHGDAGDPPEKPATPIARRYIVSDTTVEALAPILLGNPRGVLLARDELAGWIGSFDRYAKSGRGGADSAHWLSMHNGEAMTVDRKSGIPPTIHVPSASVSVTGGIQPGILARAMSMEHHESGLLARLLFAQPPRRVKRWTEADVDPVSEAAVADVFAKLLTLTPGVDADGDPTPRLIRLAPDGKAAWVAFYNAHATEQAELTGDLAAAWSKLEGYAARLALVIHLTRWAAGDASLRDPASADEGSVAAGVALARWFGCEVRRLYAVLCESDEDRAQRRIVELIRRKGGSVSVRDWQRLRSHKTAEDAEAELGKLLEAGLGRWKVPAPGAKGGRPSKVFELHDETDTVKTHDSDL